MKYLPILKIPNENSCGCEPVSESEGDGCLCPATGLVQIIGRKYALRLITLIGESGSIRFNELRTEMDEMSSSTLTIRLSELENAGLIKRKEFVEVPPRVEYTLTREGVDLRQNLFALSRFALQK